MDDKQIAKEIRSAIKNGEIEKVIDLISSNPQSLHVMTPFGTWLHVAASKGQLIIVKKLVEIGIDINTDGGPHGGNALNLAATWGHLDVVNYLLSIGVEMDVSDPVRNPLFGAISNGQVEVANRLIENGINIKVKYNGESMKEMDALAFAKEQGQREIVEILEKVLCN
ncbi:ankyrin repeat domain-containing protein [Gottfriedia solisilvae]|uniref:Ankyrin n=1 Tax=Gottfriedia solisilvae TaxID=1516104 RepID=A0A8J3AFE8_9BACI|nr:ankyrin repeat domain-containing protein [Gottfriedia solisilvae]GGI12925.1 hypothetical protein GCM10007380_15350 [Gottfriedia solisilvae]